MKQYVKYTVVMLVLLAVAIFFIPEKKAVKVDNTPEVAEADKVVDGIHVRTGLKAEGDYLLVASTCTACHSAKLVMQNRMNKERWDIAIKWMQDTQGLWDLGENQEKIVNYLVKNYPIENMGRRRALKNIAWYDMK